jgi:hypothetical protein
MAGNAREAFVTEQPDAKLQYDVDLARLNSRRLIEVKRSDGSNEIEKPLFKRETAGEFYRRRESHYRNSGCECCRKFFEEQRRRGDVARPSLPSVRTATDLHVLDRVLYGLRNGLMNLRRTKSWA